MISRAMIPARGLAGLRTLAVRSDKRAAAYKAYLRVSFLELERARHGQEIDTTRARLKRMLDRCREIETEKEAILAAAIQPSAAAITTPAVVQTPRDGRRLFGVSY
ncbi:MAG: hypothetical protein ABR878_01385 [Roseiarcus sp.]|jgi:hypothetical protein